MAAYVLRFGCTEGRWFVDYSRKPTWTLEQWDASRKLSTLQNEDLGVGAHKCSFTIEECEDGRYALKCDTHPKTD